MLIAAFDEGRSLPALLPRLPTTMAGLPVITLVVSDGSTDDTVDVARRHGAEVVELPRNEGKSAALRAGLSWVRGHAGHPEQRCDAGAHVVVLMDGDGQHDPADLPALVDPVAAGGLDVVVGSRYLHDGHRQRAPLNRRLVRAVAVAALGRQLRHPVTDPFSGYRCLSARAVGLVEVDSDRYGAELALWYETHRHGLAWREVAVRRIYGADCSKMGRDGGPLRGRLRVIGEYLRTARRHHRALPPGARSAAPAPHVNRP